MNANETKYKKDFENAIEMIDWQNTMLRQQQAEIEALKEKLNEAIDAEKDRRFE